MTRQRALELWPVIKAFGDGQTVECRVTNGSSSWAEESDPSWYADVSYRIKPAPKLRAWKDASEVPLRGLFRVKCLASAKFIPIRCDNAGVYFASSDFKIFMVDYDDLITHYEWSAQGTTFSPCGVEETF